MPVELDLATELALLVTGHYPLLEQGLPQVACHAIPFQHLLPLHAPLLSVGLLIE